MRKDQRATSQVLRGWKDIANYLGKSVRTVQRYESTMGLPVRRPPERPQFFITVSKSELEHWLGTKRITSLKKKPAM